MKPILTFLCLLTLAACATQPVPVEQAVPVPDKRILSPELLTAKDDSGTVVIVRDRGIIGMGCTAKISANKELIADLASGEKIVVYLNGGRHTLRAWPNGLCGGDYAEKTISIKKNQKLVCRVGYNQDGDFYIEPEELQAVP